VDGDDAAKWCTSIAILPEPAEVIFAQDLRAAKPTATNKTTTSRLAMVNRMGLIARSPDEWNQQPSAILNQSCKRENR
jgi:hypothetical protein